MAIDIVDFPINSMVIFNSYVKLPYQLYKVTLNDFEYLMDTILRWFWDDCIVGNYIYIHTILIHIYIHKSLHVIHQRYEGAS